MNQRVLNGKTKDFDIFDHSSKFIFVGVDIRIDDLPRIFGFFQQMNFPNAVVISKFNGRFTPITYNFFEKRFYSITEESAKIDEVFPDALKLAHGYNFKIAFVQYIDPRLRICNGTLFGPDVLMLRLFAEKFNVVLRNLPANNLPDMLNTMNMGAADLIVNNVMRVWAARRLKFITTFDTEGFCAIIPYPESKSDYDFLLKPFDVSIWIMLFITASCCAIVWRLLNRRSSHKANSASFFIFGFLSNFLGQAIPFRSHRLNQKIILQSTILLTFVLGNVYQSLIIASITSLHYVNKITTINEMIDGGYKYYVSHVFEGVLNETDYYQRMAPNIVRTFQNISLDYKELSSKRIVIVEVCGVIDAALNSAAPDVHEKYYKLDERFNSFYLEILISQQSIFREALQETSLRVFESGVKKTWTHTNPVVDVKTFKREHDEKFLKLFDVAPVFYVHALLLALSSVLFLFEVFWHKIGVKISHQISRRN